MKWLVILCLFVPSLAGAQPVAPGVDLFPSPATATATATAGATDSSAPGGPRLQRAIVDDPGVPWLGAYYGYQGLLVRLGAVGLFALAWAVSEESEGAAAALGVTSVAVFGLGPLAVHIVHDRVDNALYSFGTSLLLGLVGTFAGIVAVDEDSGGWDVISGGVLGAGVGMGVAVVVDATVFGFEDPPATGVAVAPVLMPSLDGSAAAGLGLAF